ncbi:MAG: RNA polymerase sigma factor [Polyangia bacterium]
MALSTNTPHPPTGCAEDGTESAWLEAFHKGDRETLAGCYRDHFVAVDRTIGSLLSGPDRESVIHEVFSRLIAREELRRSFRGGSFAAWLSTVARNAAIDYRRRCSREVSLSTEAFQGASEDVRWEEATHARLLLQRFQKEVLPPKWSSVFERCFIQQMSQREAARALGLRRTTLAYQEMRIRRALRRFLLEGAP